MTEEQVFQPLFEQFPTVIEQMPEMFTSHQFILALAHKNQAAYIEALYAHRDSSPFGRVHRALSQHLSEQTHLVVRLRVDAPSMDIFGHKNKCPEWKKIAPTPQ